MTSEVIVDMILKMKKIFVFIHITLNILILSCICICIYRRKTNVLYLHIYPVNDCALDMRTLIRG